MFVVWRSVIPSPRWSEGEHAGLEHYPENKPQEQINKTQQGNNNIIDYTEHLSVEKTHFFFVKVEDVSAGGRRAAAFQVEWPCERYRSKGAPNTAIIICLVTKKAPEDETFHAQTSCIIMCSVTALQRKKSHHSKPYTMKRQASL